MSLEDYDRAERQWRRDDKLAAENGHLCPHREAGIQYCPLYVESHKVGGNGCVDDVGRPCLVIRGEMKYERAVEAVRAIDPKMVALCEFNHQAEEAKRQRNCNMRAAGLQ